MPAIGYSISAINDIPAGESVNNIIENKPGVKLARRSAVDIFLSREGVDVSATVTVGGTAVYPNGPTPLNATVGVLPSTQDDNVISVIADAGDEILIAGTNVNAAAQELRALVKVLPV